MPIDHAISEVHARYRPATFVFRRPAAQPWKGTYSALVEYVFTELAKRHADVWRIVDGKTVAQFFKAHADARNKDDVARVVARVYPDLAGELPPRRKPWNSENKKMSMFDAAAAGIWYVHGDELPSLLDAADRK